MIIPGLLQTEKYARLIITAAFPELREPQIERLVQSRIERSPCSKETIRPA